MASQCFPRAAAAVLVLCVVGGCAKPNEYQPPPPPTVKVSKPLKQSVTIYLEETGTTEAVDRVEVRARVQGFLEEIKFRDGDEIKKGAPLYLIEPREYQAKVAAAEAQVKLANVEITRTKIELDRQKNLVKDSATPQSKVDQAQAEYDAALAALEAAKATLDRAKLDLEYTNVTAPISGRVERTLVKLGNLVGDSDATHLTTVLSYDPIHVYFNISERALLRATKETGREDRTKSEITDIKAFVRRSIDKDFPFKGNLDYADLGVDQSTGTFKIRAVFRNPQMRLFPGLFVRIRIPLGTEEDAVLVPERSIGADQAGRFVMIIGDDDVVERRNVVMGSKHGEMIVIDEGLSGEETVVIDGIQRARPGQKVTAEPIELKPVPSSLEAIERGSEPAEDPAKPAEDSGDAPTGETPADDASN